MAMPLQLYLQWPRFMRSLKAPFFLQVFSVKLINLDAYGNISVIAKYFYYLFALYFYY